MEIGIKTSAMTLFLGLSLLKISPVNFWFSSIPNLCKTTYGNICNDLIYSCPIFSLLFQLVAG